MTLGRYGIDLGTLTASYFGLISVAALVVGGVFGAVSARRRGLDPGAIPVFVTACLVLGTVGGRLVFVLNPPPSVAAYYDRAWYVSHVLDLQAGPLAVWNGGLDPAGVLVGAALACVAVMVRRHREHAGAWADVLCAAALAALVILPWANVVNEQMFGPPTTLPWGVALARRVPPFADLTAYPPATRFHPTPAYVSIWAVVSLLAGWLIARWAGDRLRSGDRALIAAAVALPGLFLADLLRVDVARPVLGLSTMQAAAVFSMIVVISLAVVRATAVGARRAGQNG
jgi:phosphatidylglycerol:prolipoprotein diacylglycerol transferase